MPVIQESSPFGSALEALSGFMQQRRQNAADEQTRQQQQQEFGLKSEQLRQEIAQKKAAMDLERRAQGLDPATGQPMEQPKELQKVAAPDAKGHAPSLDDQANRAMLLAEWYARQGATETAATYRAMAQNLASQAHQAEQDALRFEQLANERFKIVSQEKHWSAQEREQHRHNIAQETESVRKGTLTFEAAMAHVAASEFATSSANARQSEREGFELSTGKAVPLNPQADTAIAKLHAGLLKPNEAYSNITKIQDPAARAAALRAFSKAGVIHEPGAKGDNHDIMHLPGDVQAEIIKLRKAGVSHEGIIKMIQAAPIDESGKKGMTSQEKAEALSALGSKP